MTDEMKSASLKSGDFELKDPLSKTEIALANDFAIRHSDQLRYVAPWGQWFIWDGTCWRADKVIKVFSMVRDLCWEKANSTNKRGSWKSICSAKVVAAIEKLAKADPRLAATVDQWDVDTWLLNTPDGVIDLHTGNKDRPRPENYMTKIAAVSPGGDCPLWKKFMNEITGGSEALQKYLQRASGYSLTGDISEQELFFLWGGGNNGKSVFVLTISKIMNEYHVHAEIETFTVSKSERHPTELARLNGARLVTASETEEGRRWAESRIKQMTGGEPISAHFMRQDDFVFTPQFKLWFSGQHMPSLRSVNKAIRRRFNRIPFAVTIADDRINPHLVDDLQAEWPGILAWLIDGCLQWQRDGLNPPAEVLRSTKDYFESQDVLGEWLGECCELDANSWVSSTDLFNCWQPWARARQEYEGSERSFSIKLEEAHSEFTKCRNKERTRQGFRGLRLKALPTLTLKMSVLLETERGGVLLATDDGKLWLPKNGITMNPIGEDGIFEVIIAGWLVKQKTEQGYLNGSGRVTSKLAEEEFEKEDEIPF